MRGVLAVILSAAARPFLARRRDRQYLQLSTDLSPFLLLDRKLHFGDVVARVHVLRMLEMNQVRRAGEPVPVVFHPTIQGHVGLTEEEIISCVNGASH